MHLKYRNFFFYIWKLSRFAQSEREDYYKVNSSLSVPGPGYVKLEREFDNKSPKKGITMAHSVKKLDIIKKSPGPGAYDPKFINRSIKIMFKTDERKPLQNNTEIPGPGKYSPRDISLKTGKKFQKAKRMMSEHKDVPGPGSYSSAEFNIPCLVYKLI